MDIGSLLSPDESPASSPPDGRAEPTSSAQTSPPRQRVRPALAGGKRTASALSQELRRSPERALVSPTSTSAAIPAYSTPSSARHTAFNVHAGSATAPNFRPLPPTSNPVHDPRARQTQPQHQYGQLQRPLAAHRPSSTPHMETLADLASLQQRQQTIRTYSANSIRAEHVAVGAAPLARTISRQSLADITMAEAPVQTPPPRSFTSNALSDVEAKTVTDLLSYLAENSYAYEQHVQLINLLHKGFLAHVYPRGDRSESPAPGDPLTYALLTELRQAREAMDTRFAVGEDIWLDWLSDEILLAKTSDERVNVTELFQKATSDEPASVKLWIANADWLAANYAACHHPESTSDNGDWTVEDREICKELFTREMLLDALEQAAQATKWRIDESHIIWNRYLQMVQEQPDLDIQRVHQMFTQRLQTPHLSHEETMQLYWPIISKHEGSNWESAVAQINQFSEPAKIHANIRAEHEHKLQNAVESDDKARVMRELEKYLKSEKFHHKKSGPFDYELRYALYERAVLMFPTATDWWLDFVDFAVTVDPAGTRPLLPLIERATRHCPWSGDLWARRILRADVERQSRGDIENIKHRATNAGLLDVGGMEEFVKMLQQWCSYLRRYAFHPNASEDDLDTAEAGIIGALEDVQQAGRKLQGSDFQGDPLFRLEKIQIKFYGEARRFQDARDIYRHLAAHHANSHDFWAQYYNWELWLWGYDRVMEKRRVETDDNGPDLATAVVREALNQRNLDWPEKILEMHLAHFQQHESGTRLQQALADAREFAARLATRRAKEAEEAASVAAQQQEQVVAAAQAVEAGPGEKRKRDDELLTNGHKKARTDELPTIEERTEPSASTSAQIKRDREHNTVTVKNLSADVEEVEIRKFFRDCGDVLSVSILHEDDDLCTATVEFQSSEDVETAMTRNGKSLNGREVAMQRGEQSTLYVTNYPADYDENRIRELFKSYGDIVSIRLPSLKYNSRRRFAYVQFLTADMARSAEAAMDGKKLGGPFTLMAKISNPDAKKNRSGARAEGRELIVKNIDREAGEAAVKEFFSQYGEIEKVNLLKRADNKLTGIGFIAYSSVDEATAAVEGANNKPFRERILSVAFTEAKKGAAPQERAWKEDIKIPVAQASASPEPRRGSDVSMASAPAVETSGTAFARKIAIFNIPDTVNDARIRTVMEAFGPLVKIQLRRDREGAIVEFADPKVAFNVRQGVDVSSLGANASTGDVADLLSKKKVAKANGTGNPLAFVPPAAARPARGGRRGGLGFKRGVSSAPSGGQKSNADFRSMLEASKAEKEREE